MSFQKKKKNYFVSSFFANIKYDFLSKKSFSSFLFRDFFPEKIIFWKNIEKTFLGIFFSEKFFWKIFSGFFSLRKLLSGIYFSKYFSIKIFREFFREQNFPENFYFFIRENVSQKIHKISKFCLYFFCPNCG